MKKSTISKLLICAILLGANTKVSFAKEETIVNTEKPETRVAETENKEESTTPVNKNEKEENKPIENKNETDNVNLNPTNNNTERAVPTAVAPTPLPGNPTPSYTGTVTLVGQWTAESAKLTDSTKEFKNANDKLGDPIVNGGLLRGLAKTFLGWSDREPVGNGELATGARLFSKDDTIATAFPNGIPQDAKLYAVYFSLNNPKDPFVVNNFWDNLKYLTLMDGIKDKINKNTLTINKDLKAEDILPDTKNKSEKEEDNSRTIIDKYEEKDDVKEIHEIVLKSNFKMDDATAMLVYKNPKGSNAIKPILSRNYDDLFAGKKFSTAKDESGYTYIDLNVNLDGELNIPEKLFLEFEGYSWRPMYVLGEDYKPLNILDTNEQDLGNTFESFDNLIKNNDPKVKFGFNTNGNKNFTIRMVLRHRDQEKIKEETIVAKDGMTIAETILQDMKLKSLSKAELKDVLKGKDDEYLNKLVVSVPDKKAKELANTNGVVTLGIAGTVTGNIVADAGTVSYFSLKSNQKLKAVTSNKLNIGYTRSFEINYSFISATENKELPKEVKDLIPENKKELENHTKETLKTFTDVKVEDGTWKFRNWYSETADGSEIVANEVEINDNDLSLIGEWYFVPAPKKYDINYKFISATKGKDLPEQINNMKPQDKKSVETGTEEILNKYDDVKVEDGTWKFNNWYVEKQDEVVIAEDKAVVENEDLNLIGEWKFEENKKPEQPEPNQPEQPKPQNPDNNQPNQPNQPESNNPDQPEPEEKPVPESPKPRTEKPKNPKVKKDTKAKTKEHKLPKTNVQSAMSYALIALAGIGGAYISKKKNDEK